MFRFANSYLLYCLLVIPFLIVLYHLNGILKKKKIKEFGDLTLMQFLMPDASASRSIWKFYLYLTAMTFIIIGLARPQIGSKLQEVKRKGIEIMIALDVSNSMNAEDIKPSRLIRAKQVLAKLVDRLSDDKIGFIVFAGDAYTQVPISTDYVSVKMFLSNITTGLVPVQGTDIQKAIELASASFPTNSDLQKVIVIITDGENFAGNPEESARLADEKGILIYTLGMGTPEGAPIPVGADNSNDYKRDSSGNTVVSKLDESTLQKIAVSGGGEYISANNTQAGLDRLFEKVDRLNRKEYESKIYSEYNEQFQYFFGFALILLVIEFFIVEKKSKWLKSLKIFEINKNDS
jgi:Ca-activated chloride channel family protein